MEKDRFKICLFFLLVFLAVISVCIFRPPFIEGDSVSYVQSIQVLKSNIVPVNFVPNRIITTYLGLRSIMLIDLFLNNLQFSWLLLSFIFYLVMGMFFYLLLLRMFEKPIVAFLGTLLLVVNYAAIVFSFHYLMDIEGWALYIVSLYFSYRYLETRNNRWLWISASAVGLGGLYKEYALVAFVVVFGLVVFTEWRHWSEMIKKIFLTAILSLGPVFVINIYSFYAYHYTYLTWFFFTKDYYVHQNKFVEYIKSFGSIYNFGWFIFIGGMILLLKQYKRTLKDQKLFFIWLVCASSLVVFVWPVVTRVLFITMPAVILISTLFIEKNKKRWYLFVPIFILYVLSSFFMDSFILNFINLPF